jgi:hypothetical protein
MKISRRDFLGTVSGSAASLLSFRFAALETSGHEPERELGCAVLDLGSHCVLRESLHGYQAAVGGEHNYVRDAISDSQFRCGILIVPGLGGMEPTMAQTLSGLLKSGAHLLLESGAGFLNAAEFTVHQRMLHRYFDLTVEPPVDLWSRNVSHQASSSHRPGRHLRTDLVSGVSIPYVNYVWPCKANVRDFSRVVPVSVKAGDVIGRVGAHPVALKKRMDEGLLIFLGCPLGPALRAGDLEALSWLRLVTALSPGPDKFLCVNAIK